MRAELEALVYELKHLRREGVESIYIADGTMGKLRDVAAAFREKYPAAEATGGTDAASGAATPLSRQEVSEALRMPPPKRSAKTEEKSARTPSTIPPAPEVRLSAGDKKARWEALRAQVLADAVCREHVRPGKQIVFGVGSVDADIFFCGEAPGAEEEELGEPFVGPAGQLLTRIIQAMGLSRETVYIGNIMNWRPEMPTAFGNRPPTPEEMAYCLPYLRAQVEVVRPKVIVALGKTAVDGLLGPDPRRRIGRIRGQWSEFAGIPLLPTFHPSYLLRNNNNRTKRQVWEDLLQVMERLDMPVSEKQRGYFR